jgi:hypothetical protein
LGLQPANHLVEQDGAMHVSTRFRRSTPRERVVARHHARQEQRRLYPNRCGCQGRPRPSWRRSRNAPSRLCIGLTGRRLGSFAPSKFPGARQLVRDKREGYTRWEECFPARLRSGVANFPVRSVVKRHAGWTPIVPVWRHTMRATDGLQTRLMRSWP